MTPTPPIPLPDDPATLKAMIATLMGRVDVLEASEQRLTVRTQHLELKSLRLEMELFRYKKWVYGPRADRLTTIEQVNQMLLGFGADLDQRPIHPADAVGVAGVAAVTAEDAEQGAAPSRRVGGVKRAGGGVGGRRDLGADAFAALPVTRCEHDLAEHDKPCPCCGTVRAKIGEESSWQLEYIPGHFERLEHVRFTYACARCEKTASPDGPQIERADPPTGVIDKGLAGPGLLAFIVTSKFSDYLPLYRLEDIFARAGVEIARSTMSLWCRDAAEILTPLHDLMKARVLRSTVIGTDDTIMPMQAPGLGRTRKARMWVYVGDEDNPYTVFDFTLGRSRDGPAAFLTGYTGTLLADAYGGYDGVVVGNPITRAGCWAHARRKFVDAEASHPAIAAEAVSTIGALYAVEERGKAMDAQTRGALRRAESAPILTMLKEKLHAWRDQLVPKHPMAQAAGYALNQWSELSVFAGLNAPPGPAAFGAVPIDNNASEREMKRIVLNRKNSLFVGNERAGRAAAILSGLASTCRRHGIDPQRYLTQLLVGLPAAPAKEIDRWLPDEWKRRDTPKPAG